MFSILMLSIETGLTVYYDCILKTNKILPINNWEKLGKGS